MTYLDYVARGNNDLRAPALSGDVGYDLPALHQVVIWGRRFAEIHTGIQVAFPAGVWGMTLPRSSSNRGGRLLVLPGVIDEGYRGEIFLMVHNLSDYMVVVQAGERLGQLVLFPSLTFPLRRVEELPASERGTSGFGSTGT